MGQKDAVGKNLLRDRLAIYSDGYGLFGCDLRTVDRQSASTDFRRGGLFGLHIRGRSSWCVTSTRAAKPRWCWRARRYCRPNWRNSSVSTAVYRFGCLRNLSIWRHGRIGEGLRAWFDVWKRYAVLFGGWWKSNNWNKTILLFSLDFRVFKI